MAAVAPQQLVFPTAWLNPGAEFTASLKSSVEAGIADAINFASYHQPDEKMMIVPFAINKMPYAPKEDVEKVELAELHSIVPTRNDAMTATSEWLSKYSMDAVWEHYLHIFSQRVGATQAAAGAKLLHDTLDFVNQATQISKASNMRKRPFVVDPNLPLTVPKPGNNPSFPSGHSSESMAGAVVMASLLPDKAAEIMRLAEQSAYARMYAGVHFKSDVMAGVKLGAIIASYMVHISKVQPAGAGSAAAAAKPAPAAAPVPAAAGQAQPVPT